MCPEANGIYSSIYTSVSAGFSEDCMIMQLAGMDCGIASVIYRVV
jgi:hypothetical protein